MKSGDFKDEWQRLWLKFSEIPLVYTDQEKDWATVFTLGTEWARLFEVIQPTLPICHPKFQLQYRTELWPGDINYGELEFYGIVDILSTASDGSRMIVDVKTAKSLLSVAPGMMALDGQLRKYAWVSGVPEVGFLNFVKCDPTSFRKGDTVTLLTKVLGWEPGTELTIAKYDKDLNAYYLATEDKVAMCERESFSKVKIQFVRGTVPEADMKEIGDAIGADMIALKSSADRDLWPKDGGVRFPNAICGWCEMRGICLNQPKLTKELLVQIKADSDDWLRDLEEETE